MNILVFTQMYNLHLVKSGFYSFGGPINVQVMEKSVYFPRRKFDIQSRVPWKRWGKKHPLSTPWQSEHD